MGANTMRRNVSRFLFIIYSIILIDLCSSWLDEEEQQKPLYLTANVGEHVVFNCDLDFPHDVPIPYILKWNKDGKSVFSWYEQVLTVHEDPFVGRINLVDQEGFGKGSVNLTSIRESDHGWYQCKVLFPNRNPSSRNNGTWFYLTVQGGNLLEIPPINETSMEGEQAQFTCVAKNPSSTRITWYKDGKPVRNLPDLSSRSFEAEDGTLTIKITSMSDLGEYECEAVNVYNERQSARAYLNVQFKAKVVYAPKEVYFSYGEPAILDCHFRSNPPLKHLRWEKDGYLFDPYNVQGVFYKRNGSLFFKQIDENHAGIYTCTPFNELGTDGPSTGIRVIVQRPPVFQVTPNNLYLRKMGEDIEMPCDASDGDGSHKPAISWKKLDGILPEGRYNIRDGNLTIVRLQDSDRGIYQCSASNQAATITTETELIVENSAPRAPMNITAYASHTAVTLKWVPGQVRANGHKIDYNVWYKPVEQTEWRTIRIGQGLSEVTIGDLNPGRLYEFMVLTQDHLGDGMFSKSVTVRTKGAVIHQSPEEMKSVLPIGCPRNVTVILTVEGYLVSWEEPDFGLEHVKEYNIKWFRGHMDDLAGSVNTTNLHHLIRYLEEDNSYIFIVYSISDLDYSSPSEKVILMVPAYKKIRAVSITIMVTVALLGIGFGLFYFLRKRCFKHYHDKKASCNSS